MRRMIGLMALLFWIAPIFAAAVPTGVPECCRTSKKGYCPIKKARVKSEHQKVSQPSCHSDTSQKQCAMKSVCTHQTEFVLFWFDGILPSDTDALADLSNSPLHAPVRFDAPDCLRVLSPPPRRIL